MAEKHDLTGIFTGAVIGLATGFATEFFTFPFFHNSTIGMHLVNFANEAVLPFYEAAAGMLGITAPNLAAAAPVAGLPEVAF